MRTKLEHEPEACISIDNLELILDNDEALTAKRRSLLKALRDFRIYITTNAQLIPNYGERWRYGEAIATGFVESTVNQVVSKRFVKRAADEMVAARSTLSVTDTHARAQR